MPDPLLDDRPGHVALLLGNEAVVRGALEAGVAYATGYPGTPSSEITDTFARIAPELGIPFEYAVNEKVALELAFAASLAGARAICAMKHLGLMVAGDPLSTIPYVGVVGGLVIVSAADPSCLTSPNEADQRHLARMLHIPVIDPPTPADAQRLTREAFALSEEAQLPVLLRITTRVAHTRAPVRFQPRLAPRVSGFVRDPSRFIPIPVNARRLRLEIPERLAVARRWNQTWMQRADAVSSGSLDSSGGSGSSGRSGSSEGPGSGRRVVIAAGAPAATVADLLDELGATDDVTLITLPGVWPLPEDALAQLLEAHRLEESGRVLVVEELSPFLEDALHALASRRGIRVDIRGKRTGDLPEPFEYSPEIIRAGLRSALGLGMGLGGPARDAPEVEAPAVPGRPPVLCPSCPHRSSFFAARTVFGDEPLMFGDIGCYTLGAGAPLNGTDALLCMGAGFSMAAGASRVTGRKTLGFLGDSTFFHAGMPPLLGAIKEDVDMVAVVLDNCVTAMTGFQDSPGVALVGGKPERQVDIAGVARALGAEHVEVFDPTNLPAAVSAFERARDRRGLSVLVARSPCPVYTEKATGQPAHTGAFQITGSLCATCGRESSGMGCGQSPTISAQRVGCLSRVAQIGERPSDVKGGAELFGAELLGAGTLELETPGVAACSAACPLGVCIQGYAARIAAGELDAARELIASRIPLPESVCRVCHRPCEVACVRAGTDGAVAVNDLKRFVMEQTVDAPPWRPTLEAPNGRAVAVVGAGPAGLAAAWDLRQRGYDVTVYDAAAQPGGLLRSGIPRFRLPLDALERDLAGLEALGVTFVGGRRLGQELSLTALLADHDAVFLALGAHRPAALELPAVPGGPDVQDALSFLARDQGGVEGAGVLVIGGGNAAVDVARAALRRGALEVAIVCPEPRDDMPALACELAAAEEEGVEILDRRLPRRLLERRGVECLRAGAPTGDGLPPTEPGSEHVIHADLVVTAIGQRLDQTFLGPADPPLDIGREGLTADPDTGRTAHSRIFAGGDMIAGGRTVTGAMAAGLRGAWGLDAALRGPEIADRRRPPPKSGDWPGPDLSWIRAWKTSRRLHPPTLEPAERRRNSGEVVGAFEPASARAEAARCLGCGGCRTCRACLDLFGCPAFVVSEGEIRIDPLLCNGCGVCAELCPNGAIQPCPNGAIQPCPDYARVVLA